MAVCLQPSKQLHFLCMLISIGAVLYFGFLWTMTFAAKFLFYCDTHTQHQWLRSHNSLLFQLMLFYCMMIFSFCCLFFSAYSSPRLFSLCLKMWQQKCTTFSDVCQSFLIYEGFILLLIQS